MSIESTNKYLPITQQEAEKAFFAIKNFISRAQLSILDELCQGEERQFFMNKYVELADLIEKMPTTYQTDGQGDQAVVYLHYFGAGFDWYVTERDCEVEQLQAFGLTNMGWGVERGYINIVEIFWVCGAELDLYWTPKKLAEIAL